MERRPFGRTGVTISNLALGCMNFGAPTPRAESRTIIDRALDAGIDVLDTADFYGAGESERVVGEALAPSHKRDAVFLASKGHFPTSADPKDRGNSRRHLLAACEASLERLGTDRLDLYQVHRPDLDTAHDETLRALDDLVRAGKVRYVGTSTHPAWFLMEGIACAERHGWSRYASEQPPYNLLDRRIENELLPFARRHDVAILPWSPLGMGLLAGRYDRAATDAAAAPADSRVARLGGVYAERVTATAVDAARRIATIARDAGLEPAVLALAWVRTRPGVTAPITGPRTLAHLETALAAADVTLTDAVCAALDEVVPPGTAVADFLNNSGVGRVR